VKVVKYEDKMTHLVQSLRKKHPRFIYQGFNVIPDGKNLKISFKFKTEPNIYFSPFLIIRDLPSSYLDNFNQKVFDNLAFHLGLMEIPSYWKATCSPKIIIEASTLTKNQIQWWKDLILKGMGEFFYQNRVNFTQPNFFSIQIKDKQNPSPRFKGRSNPQRILLPLAGGKDSTVALEILKETRKEIKCFSLNPTKATKRIIKIGGCSRPIIVKREIDPKLLELNKRGYLNGHTPFSAYLAFLSLTCAYLFGYGEIAFANERSANEGSLVYLGKEVNHQYSKSSDFEQKFRKYIQKYLAKNINYFSLLRPLFEIQIAKLFADYPQYWSAFRSCNKHQKTDSWCCQCPKCVFVFTVLYPFLDSKKLIKIFGGNLYEKKNTLQIIKQLIGEEGEKPFECVGTKEETLIALYLSLKKAKQTPLPLVLQYLKEKVFPKYSDLETKTKKILTSWDSQNYLPPDLERILKKKI
jgi:hypothetical protein